MWPFHNRKKIDADQVHLHLSAAYPDCDIAVTQADAGLWQVIVTGDARERDILAALKQRYNWSDKEVRVLVSQHHKPATKKPSSIEIVGAGQIIAVASGKGGVGKSTVAAGLAIALAEQGHRVGLLDADIYGPSMPIMMGLAGQKPTQNDAGKIVPLVAHGVYVMSIGFMVDPAQALIWRGPMVQSAFKQLLTDVAWPDLDILILDTPPGTGDVQLTLAQSITVAGAVIVSTPQELALADARKGVAMFQKLNVPIIGLLENMSGEVFGTDGARTCASKLMIPYLGSIPLDASIRKACDAGHPTVHDAIKQVAQEMMKTIGLPHEPPLHSVEIGR